MLAKKLIEKTLIDTCSDPGTGNSLLMYATIENKIDFISRLIGLGAQVNKTNQEKYTALHFAAMYSREDTIQHLLQRKANPNLLGGPMKQTCVHLASARMSGQSTPIVELLLQHSNKELEEEIDALQVFDICIFFPINCALCIGTRRESSRLPRSQSTPGRNVVTSPVNIERKS